MTEKEKAAAGYLYNPNYDEELLNEIGDNTVIGAGSVVTKDIPSNVIAVGTPCRVIREITDKDKERHPIYREKY